MSFKAKLVGNEEERAVSPVIGVILMVAITVILAAVIAAFVLDMGQSQESSVNAGVNVDESPTEVEVGWTSQGSANSLAVEASITDYDEVETAVNNDGGSPDAKEDQVSVSGAGSLGSVGERSSIQVTDQGDLDNTGDTVVVRVTVTGESDGQETVVHSEEYEVEVVSP